MERMRDELRLGQYSLRTEQTYCDWVERYIRFHKLRHPSKMREDELAEFLTHLARDGKVAASTQSQHVRASLTCQERVKSNWCFTFVYWSLSRTLDYRLVTRLI